MKKEFGLAAGVFMGIFTILAIGQGPAPQNPQVPPPGMQIGTEFGFAIFQQQCMGCHGNPNAPLKAPEPSALRQLTPEAILDALTTGAMKVQGQALSDAQKKQVSESLSSRPLGTATEGEAANMPNRCATNPPLPNPSSAAAWNGWGADVANTRFQSAKAAGLIKEDVPRLTLKWAFGYPNGVSALSQPTVVSGRLFVGADTGYVYSLDANTGCVYWSFKTKAGVRSALSVGPVSGPPEPNMPRTSATCWATSTRWMLRPGRCSGRATPRNTSPPVSLAPPRSTTAACTCRSRRGRNFRPRHSTIPVAPRAAASRPSTPTPGANSGRLTSSPKILNQ